MNDVKQRLLAATARLLERDRPPEDITAREIASAADANLAMINYYFKSKDELLYQAVGELMREEADSWLSLGNGQMPAYQRLRRMLISMCEITLKYARFTGIAVEYELTKADISVPQYILPMMREITGGARSEFSLRITAYEIVSVLQLIYLRAKDVSRYVGLDVLAHDNLVLVIDELLKSHFPEGGDGRETL